MPKDLSQTKWHGIPRRDIPWFPTVAPEKCIGCELCYVTCGREVYEMTAPPRGPAKATAERPYNCMVGCSTCATVCPTQAISFPTREVVWRLEREFKIFQTVRAEAREKRTRTAAMADRQQAQQQPPRPQTRLFAKVAGVFGEKRFLMQLQELIQDRPVDLENVQLHVPTLKGLKEDAPGSMTFDVVSTEQDDVRPFLDELKRVTAKNDLVWIEE